MALVANAFLDVLEYEIVPIIKNPDERQNFVKSNVNKSNKTRQITIVYLKKRTEILFSA